MTEDEKRTLIRRYLDAYNAFDVDGMIETLRPDVEIKNVTDGEISAAAAGVEEFREMAEKAAELFASRRQTITAFATEEEDDRRSNSTTERPTESSTTADGGGRSSDTAHGGPASRFS